MRRRLGLIETRSQYQSLLDLVETGQQRINRPLPRRALHQRVILGKLCLDIRTRNDRLGRGPPRPAPPPSSPPPPPTPPPPPPPPHRGLSRWGGPRPPPPPWFFQPGVLGL